MSSSGAYKIFIPSVFIGRSSGILIDSAYTYKNKTLVIITNDDADLSYLLIPFICVVSVCFIIAISIFVSFKLKIYFIYGSNRFCIQSHFNIFILRLSSLQFISTDYARIDFLNQRLKKYLLKSTKKPTNTIHVLFA